MMTSSRRNGHVEEIASAASALICLERVEKTYSMGNQQVHALAGVSAEILPGAFCAIMGPSGSGKSTMMNVLGCLDRPTAGTYRLKGRDVTRLDDDRLSELRLKELGFIFQSFNLIPQLTVQENIELPLYYLGWDSRASGSRARKLAATVGLKERLDHRPAELSGGQQQRVAIARALANDPEILLADEPTGNLDSTTGEQIMTLVSELNKAGKTIIMVTHDADVAAYAGHRFHMLDGVIDRYERN